MFSNMILTIHLIFMITLIFVVNIKSFLGGVERGGEGEGAREIFNKIYSIPI